MPPFESSCRCGATSRLSFSYRACVPAINVGAEVEVEVDATGRSGGTGSMSSSPPSSSLLKRCWVVGDSPLLLLADNDGSGDVSDCDRVRLVLVAREEVEARGRSEPGGGPVTPSAFASEQVL